MALSLCGSIIIIFFHDVIAAACAHSTCCL